MNRTIAGLMLAAVSGLVLTGCSSDSGTGSAASAMSATSATSMPEMVMPSAQAASETGEIVVSEFRFAVPATVSPGQQIIVRNEDTVEHSVSADSSGAFDVDVDGGETVTLTAPSTSGVYAFHCEYHPNMVGTLDVG